MAWGQPWRRPVDRWGTDGAGVGRRVVVSPPTWDGGSRRTLGDHRSVHMPTAPIAVPRFSSSSSKQHQDPPEGDNMSRQI
jgi:hypothetical protein